MKKYLLAVALLGLAACGDNSNGGGGAVVAEPTPTPPAPEPNASFEVATVNLTLGQPLSPLTIFLHDGSEAVFSVGQPASDGLELLAESGDNSQLLDDFGARASVSGGAPLGPGASQTLAVELDGSDTAGVSMSLVSMLVNTNDAITGFNRAAVETLAIGDSMTISTRSYDSGTEHNSEQADTIPGPAGGGEGFNAARDDIRDQVTLHPGVVSAADGLSGSGLGQQHRWDNPVARVTITRTQ